MSPEYVEDHFIGCGETKWLAALGTSFTIVPMGAKRRNCKVEPPQKPYCVLGSLAKAFHCSGNSLGAQLADADFEDSLLAANRLTFTVDHGSAYGCQARKVRDYPLYFKAEHPTLWQVSRAHVLAIWQGLIFDSLEQESLSLTHDNLSQCIGALYQNDIVRGYMFVPHEEVRRPPHVTQAHAERAIDEALGGAKRQCLDGARVCSQCAQTLLLEAFSTTQRRKGSTARCRACVG
jgi:hypothetical protein